MIANHLREDHNKFVDFLLLTAEQLDFLLELMQDDLSKKS